MPTTKVQSANAVHGYSHPIRATSGSNVCAFVDAIMTEAKEMK
jgi:hypothetical protein